MKKPGTSTDGGLLRYLMNMKIPATARSRLLALGIFAVAFGWLEAIIVIYLRKLIGLEGSLDMMDSAAQAAILQKFAAMRSVGEGGFLSPAYLRVEQIREAATIVMLAAAGWLAGANIKQRAAYFLYAFGIWDIVYYAALWLLVRWPPSPKTLDVLFLIPFEWVAQVWIPMAISCIFIIGSIWSLRIRTRGSRR